MRFMKSLPFVIKITDEDNHKAFCLNQTSMLVWQNCDGDKGISEIASEMSRRLNQPVKSEVVWLALEDFKEEGLITTGAS